MIIMLKQYFKDFYTYTLDPAVKPDNADFIDFFLLESKQGYCLHFASSATIILRSLGIPTRIAEGYILPRTNAVQALYQAKNKGEDFYQVSIKDRNAHAWIEVFIEDFGWIPFDVTPGNGLNEINMEDSQTNIPESTTSPSIQPSTDRKRVV